MRHKSTAETLNRSSVRIWFHRWTCRSLFRRPQCSTRGPLYREAIWWPVLMVGVCSLEAGSHWLMYLQKRSACWSSKRI